MSAMVKSSGLNLAKNTNEASKTEVSAIYGNTNDAW